MKSIAKQIRHKMNKKGYSDGGGTVGLIIGLIAGVAVGALFLIFILYALGQINISTLFPQTGSTSFAGNISQAAVNNVTQTVGNFTGGLPIVGSIAAVLILVAVIVVLFVYLGRMRESATGGSQTI